MALVAGLVFLAVAAAYLAGAATDVRLDPRWVVPVVLVALGVAGLLGSLARMGREAGAKGNRPAPPRRRR
jgi:hypothetical protein